MYRYRYSRRFFLFLLTVLLSSCAPKLVLKPNDFNALPSWHADTKHKALIAFLKSCKKITSLPGNYDMGIAGSPDDWLPVCEKARSYLHATKMGDSRASRFFETYFVPFKVHNHFSSEGLFTGYYEPALKGSRTRTARYQHPVYRRPPDLAADQPYLSRRTIEEGALAGKGLELVYVDDPVALFFLHVQGSGRILLEDGTMIRIGFDGKNNCPYSSVGKYLIDQKELQRDEVTAESIKQWLRDHPEQAEEVMQMNQSYVFFRELQNGGPYGAQDVALTPEASLAVDKEFIPYGVPVWLQTTLPDIGEGERPFNKLLIAQDTGSAIKGPVRGDVFFGYGRRAEKLAGNMKQRGEYYILLPKNVVVKYGLRG